MKQTLNLFLGASVVLASVAVLAFVLPVAAANYSWDTSGEYVIAMEYQGSDNDHDVTLMQDASGNLTGNGGSPAGNNTYLWTITDGTVTGNSIEFTADYTATADAVYPQTTLTVEGTIANDGTMSGTWSDNYEGDHRSGTWMTTSGDATKKHTGSDTHYNSADTDKDGFISVAEGVPFYGGIEVSLTKTGDTSPDSGLALNRFPVADSNGNYSYKRTFTVSNEVRDSIADGHIIIHGIDIDQSGEYDGAKPSSIAPELPFEATVPAACGLIMKSHGKTYTANLTELNSTGANGNATITLHGNTVTVNMNVFGTSPNLPHAQHIHIGGTNECPPNTSGVAGVDMDDSSTVAVTITKFIQGQQATAQTADNADFPMQSSWNATNVGNGTGTFVLGDTNTVPYQAVTAPMTKGADYSTKEMVNGNVVGAQCATGKPFALQGYTSGTTMTEAMNATPSMAKPSFTNMQQDKYVIVWNRDCALPEGEIGGDVVIGDAQLEVTSIDMIKTTAIANGTFADGWEYVFNITAPMDEQNIAMKFSDWLQTDGNDTIPVANNMRISSLQADNGGSTILLTAPNVYSTPYLHMIGDLEPQTAGRQVEITVEVAVPNGTANGSYTTSYGVRSD